MIIITGSAGMIGSVTAWHLNSILGENDLILCDDLAHENQEKNFNKRKYLDFVKKDQLLTSLRQMDVKKLMPLFTWVQSAPPQKKFFLSSLKIIFVFHKNYGHTVLKKKYPLSMPVQQQHMEMVHKDMMMF